MQKTAFCDILFCKSGGIEMENTLLPSYTRTAANRLSKLKIKSTVEPANTRIFWLNSFSAKEKSFAVSMETHMHTFFEAHFVISGEMTYGVGDEEVCVRAGQGIIFLPRKSHIVKRFSDELVRISLTFLPEEKSDIYKNVTSASGRTFDLDEKILGCLDEILAESGRQSEISAVLTNNRISDLICRTARLFGDEKKSSAEAYDDGGEIRIEMVKQYIHDNSGRLLTCREVAGQCHFNEKYLGRLFKARTGMTMLEYIHLQKLRQAQELLDDEKLSLKSVSELLGFANEYYFNSFFKRLSGITPGQYRKNISPKNQ